MTIELFNRSQSVSECASFDRYRPAMAFQFCERIHLLQHFIANRTFCVSRNHYTQRDRRDKERERFEHKRNRDAVEREKNDEVRVCFGHQMTNGMSGLDQRPAFVCYAVRSPYYLLISFVCVLVRYSTFCAYASLTVNRLWLCVWVYLLHFVLISSEHLYKALTHIWIKFKAEKR